jgi:hypothetical protein
LKHHNGVDMNACWTLLLVSLAAAAAAADVKDCFGAAAPIACFQTLAYRSEHLNFIF